MRLTIRPMMDPRTEIDARHLLVKAIAEELWRRYQGNEVLNWMEAEWHVEGLFERARSVEPPTDLTVAAGRGEPASRPVVEVRRVLPRPLGSPRRLASSKRPVCRLAEAV